MYTLYTLSLTPILIHYIYICYRREAAGVRQEADEVQDQRAQQGH